MMRGNFHKTVVVALSLLVLGGLKASAQLVTLFGVTNVWKYDQTTDYTDAGLPWFMTTFDDSAWPSGPGLLYVESANLPAPKSTMLTLGRLTYYFRTHFNFTGDPANATLISSNLLDDGAVYYLNGIEVGRLGMNPGPVTYSTLSGRVVGDANTWEELLLDSSPLVQGDNVLAVEVHQQADTSSDVVFGMQLEASIPEQVTITNQPQSQTVIEGATVTFSVGADGAPPFFYQWFKDGFPLTDATNQTLVLTNVTSADAGAYFVDISSGSFGATSQDAILTVTTDNVPPTLISAVANTNLTSITVSFSEPIDNLTGTATDRFNYEVAPTGGGGFPANPDLISIENETNAVLSYSGLTPGVNYTLTVNVVSDRFGNQIAPNSQIAVSAEIVLLPIDDIHQWRYDQNGDDLGTAWKDPEYDDSSWPSGAALLADETAGLPEPIRTPLTVGANKLTFYFRSHFDFPGDPAGAVLRLNTVIDDGAVVYLNGQEVFRIGVADGQTATSTSSRVVGDATYEGPFDIPATSLKQGDNLIAVEVHQQATSSSDVVMGIQVLGVVSSFPTGPVSIVQDPQDASVAEGEMVTFTVEADGARPLTYQWLKDGTPIPGANSQAYVLTNALPSDAGSYVARVSNSQNTADSNPATLTVAADTIAPTVVSAIGTTNLSEIIISFSEPLFVNTSDPFDLRSAANTSNYSVTPAGGGTPLTALSATVTNLTNVVLVTQARTPGTAYNLTINNVADVSAAHNAVAPDTQLAVSQVTVLIDVDDTTMWRYDETGQDLGSAWIQPAYDDSSWPQGAAILAVETATLPAAIRTTLSLTNMTTGETNITFYFRTHFNYSGSTTGIVLRLLPIVDDGAVFYLNGQEIYRLGVTNNPVTYTDFASRTVGDADLEGPFTVPPDALQNGDNVLAAEVHQINLTSSDITFGLILEALTSASVPDTGMATLGISRSGTDVTLSWDGTGFTLEEAKDVNGPWTASANQANPQTVDASTGTKFFRLSK